MTQHIIKQHFSDTLEAINKASLDEQLISSLEIAVNKCIESLKSGGKIMLAGNGGSASDSQHIAAEIVGRLQFDRPALPAIALTTDTSILTAIANDYGYDDIFSRQVAALGNANDIFIGISTSGNSANVVKAVKSAKDKNIFTIAMTGEAGNTLAEMCDVSLKAPAKKTHNVQETHIMLGHTLCSLIESTLYG